MKVIVSGMAWLDRKELEPHQIKNIKDGLTVRPRKTTMLGDEGPPPPIYLYDDQPENGLLGVPRGYYLKNKSSSHEEVIRLSTGDPMIAMPSLWKADVDGPYTEQVAALANLEAYVENNRWGGMILKAGCGFGKTAVGIELAKRLGRKTLILVHETFFLRQWKNSIKKFLPDARIGFLQQDRCDYKNVDFTIAMIQSLSGDGWQKYPAEIFDAFGLTITDECFVGNTKIKTIGGLKRIDKVERGESVLNAVGHGVVRNIGSRLVDVLDLRIVRFEDGSEDICTAEHPFFTKLGWQKAADLQDESVLTFGDSIGIMRRYGTCEKILMPDMREVKFGENRKEILFNGMCGAGEAQTSDDVRVLRGGGDEAEKYKILFDILSAEVDVGELRSFCTEAQRCREGVAQEESAGEGGGVEAHDGEESNARCRDSEKGIGQACGDEASSASEGRQWGRDVGSSVDVADAIGEGMGVRSSDKNRCEACESTTVSDKLQSRHCESGENDSGRGGRQFPFFVGKKGNGREEDLLSGSIKVESVKIPQREDFERHGVSLEGDRVRVYNLTVSGHPSYILENGGVVHNCHRIGAATWADVVRRFSSVWRLGLTATPRRLDGAEDVFFSHIGPIVYAATTEAQRPLLRRLYTNTELKGISRGSYQIPVGRLNSSQVASQLVADKFRTRDIVDQIIGAVVAKRKILVVSERLQQLKDLAEDLGAILFDRKLPFTPTIDFYTGQWFTGEEIRIKGRKPKPKMRTRTEEDLEKAERANVIFATKQMVAEGLDIQALDVIVFATPLGDIEQAVGRVRRWCEPEPGKCEHYCAWRAGVCRGKPQPIVLDVIDEKCPTLLPKWKRRKLFYKSLGTL